jgi:hypothetical protein
MSKTFSQNDHLFGQCEHFQNQIIYLKKSNLFSGEIKNKIKNYVEMGNANMVTFKL